MLVGNKYDESAELREVSNTEGQGEAAAWGVSFMETSAKTNHNVTELFQVRLRKKTISYYLRNAFKLFVELFVFSMNERKLNFKLFFFFILFYYKRLYEENSLFIFDLIFIIVFRRG